MLRDSLREEVYRAYRRGDSAKPFHTDTIATGTCADCEHTYTARHDLMLEVNGKNHLIEYSLCDACLPYHREILDNDVSDIEREVAWQEQDETDKKFRRESYRGAV